MTRRSDQHKPASRDFYLSCHSSDKVTVSLEGYQQILDVIRATAVCEDCKRLYSEGPEHINVAGLLCLQCFLMRHQSLTFIGPLPPGLQGEREEFYHPIIPEKPTYFFLDADGHAYLTNAGIGKGPDTRKSIPVTLKYWGFPRPERGERNGQAVELGDFNWSVYGDVRNDDVVLLQYGSSWYKNEILFMAERNGRYVQINRRRPNHRQALKYAREELEETQTPGGMYLVNGEYQSSIHESDIYQLVAKWIGEELKAKRAEDSQAAADRAHQEEPETGAPAEPQDETPGAVQAS